MNDNEKVIACKIIQLGSEIGYIYSYSLGLFKFLLIYEQYFLVSRIWSRENLPSPIPQLSVIEGWKMQSSSTWLFFFAVFPLPNLTNGTSGWAKTTLEMWKTLFPSVNGHPNLYGNGAYIWEVDMAHPFLKVIKSSLIQERITQTM